MGRVFGFSSIAIGFSLLSFLTSAGPALRIAT